MLREHVCIDVYIYVYMAKQKQVFNTLASAMKPHLSDTFLILMLRSTGGHSHGNFLMRSAAAFGPQENKQTWNSWWLIRCCDISYVWTVGCCLPRCSHLWCLFVADGKCYLEKCMCETIGELAEAEPS